MTYVVKVGGSAIDEVDFEFIKKISSELKEIKDVVVVCGGGKTARKYIHAAKKFGASETLCDYLGIDASRLNALVLISALGNIAHERVVCRIENIKEILSLKKIPVLGGTHPGHTTDAVAALVSEYVGASLLLMVTDVDGIYTSDPDLDKNAKKLKKISFEDLDKFVTESFAAGKTSVIDPLAAKIIIRSKIKTLVISKRENLINAVKGKHGGTEIGD